MTPLRWMLLCVACLFFGAWVGWRLSLKLITHNMLRVVRDRPELRDHVRRLNAALGKRGRP